jgi:hypothetical protein
MGRTMYQDQSVKISDIVPPDRDVIEDESFKNCELIGPALIAPKNCKFDGVGFAGAPDAILWEVPEGFRIGAIGVVNCNFMNCRFRGIGIVGVASTIKQFRDALSSLRPVKIFYSYSHKDADLRNELGTHLAALRRWQTVEDWYDRKITPGEDWDKVIDERLRTTDIILALISSDFIQSDYCTGVELRVALERHEAGEAHFYR